MSEYPSKRPAARRQRVYRHRQVRGINVYPVEVDDKGIEGLIATGHLPVNQATDKHRVAAAIAEVIRALGKAT